MLKITGGEFKNKSLNGGNDKNIRPTTAKMREAIFNIIASMELKEDRKILQNAVVADICSGSGVLLMEAISRGASGGVCVDKNKKSLQIAKDNAKKIGITKKCRFLECDAVKLPRVNTQYGLIFIDPPYDDSILNDILNSLISSDWLASDTLVFIEASAKAEIEFPENLEILRDKKYGISRLICVRREG